MQSKQQLARVAAGRLGCKTGHRTYGHDESGAIRLPSPAMAGLNPSSADGVRPRRALLVANDNPVPYEAGHTCTRQCGIRAHRATTVISALLGTLRTDARSRAEFFALARVPASSEPT